MTDMRPYDPLETSHKLDHTLQAYGRLERKFAERGREIEQLQRIVDSVRSKTALDVVAEKLQAQDNLRQLQDRLAAIECLLGLLPSTHDRQGKTVWLAFQLALGREGEAIEGAMRSLEVEAPGFLRRAEDFARDMKGQRVAALLRLAPLPEPKDAAA